MRRSETWREMRVSTPSPLLRENRGKRAKRAKTASKIFMTTAVFLTEMELPHP